MGQRLVISLFKNNEKGDEYCIAKIYYHWSAYQLVSMFEAIIFSNKFFYDENFTKIKDEQLRAIRIVESLGGGISEGATGNEFKFIQNKYPQEKFKTECISRNCGLIAITQEGMDTLEYYSEGDIYLNIDNKTIYNNVIWGYDSIEELNHDYEFDTPANVKMFTELPNNPEECLIDDYKNIYNIISNKIDTFCTNTDKDKVLAAFNPYFYSYKNIYYYIPE